MRELPCVFTASVLNSSHYTLNVLQDLPLAEPDDSVATMLQLFCPCRVMLSLSPENATIHLDHQPVSRTAKVDNELTYRMLSACCLRNLDPATCQFLRWLHSSISAGVIDRRSSRALCLICLDVGIPCPLAFTWLPSSMYESDAQWC